MFWTPKQHKTIEKNLEWEKKEQKAYDRPSKIECELSILEEPYQNPPHTYTGQFSPYSLFFCCTPVPVAAFWKWQVGWMNEKRWQYSKLCNWYETINIEYCFQTHFLPANFDSQRLKHHSQNEYKPNVTSIACINLEENISNKRKTKKKIQYQRRESYKRKSGKGDRIIAANWETPTPIQTIQLKSTGK